MTDMVDTDRDSIAHGFTRVRYVLFQIVQALFRDMDARKTMLDVVKVINTLFKYIFLVSLSAALEFRHVGISTHVFQNVFRPAERSRLVQQKVNAHIHL